MGDFGFRATWDSDDSWSRFFPIGIHAENQGSWVQPPHALPYRRGHGLIETAYSVQTGVGVNWGYGIVTGAQADGACALSVAMRVESIDIGGADQRGPVVFSSRDDSLLVMATPAFSMQSQGGTGGSPIVRLISNEGDTSEWLDLSPWINAWVWFDFRVTRGAQNPSNSKYWHEGYCDVWVLHGIRPKFLKRLVISTGFGDRFDSVGFVYDLPILGFLGTDETADSYKFRVDEVACQVNAPAAVPTGKGQVLAEKPVFVGLPSPRHVSEEVYPLEVRVSRYDTPSSSFKVAYTFPLEDIRDVKCSFLSHRIERSAEVVVSSPGQKTPAKAKDVLADMETHVGRRYRLDILAPHQQDLGEVPLATKDHMVFWSGEVLGVRRNFGDQTVTLRAIGWTAKLDLRMVQFLDERGTDIDGLLDLLLATADWPTGTLTKTTDANSTIFDLAVRSFVLQQDTILGGIKRLLSFGQYAAGVSVSGYPHAQSNEFRLHFFESKHVAEDDIPAPGSAGLGHGIGMLIDLDDPQVALIDEDRDDSEWRNEWYFIGESKHVDLVSVVTGIDRQRIRDNHSNGVSGPVPIEGNEFTGMNLVLLDRVFREDDRFVFLTGQIIPGKSVGALPTSLLQGKDGSSQFPVRLTTNTLASPGYVDLFVHELPAHEEDLTLDITEEAIRYTIRNAGARVLRRIIDQEEFAATDALRRQVTNSEVRGWMEAARFAFLDRSLERRQSRRLRLTKRGVRTLPNGHDDPKYNRVQVLDGASRLTRLGTTGNGGDNWAMDDDERPVGLGRVLEIQSVSCAYTPTGWDMTYVLGGTPVDLVPVVTRKVEEVGGA